MDILTLLVNSGFQPNEAQEIVVELEKRLREEDGFDSDQISAAFGFDVHTLGEKVVGGLLGAAEAVRPLLKAAEVGMKHGGPLQTVPSPGVDVELTPERAARAWKETTGMAPKMSGATHFIPELAGYAVPGTLLAKLGSLAKLGKVGAAALEGGYGTALGASRPGATPMSAAGEGVLWGGGSLLLSKLLGARGGKSAEEMIASLEGPGAAGVPGMKALPPGHYPMPPSRFQTPALPPIGGTSGGAGGPIPRPVMRPGADTTITGPISGPVPAVSTSPTVQRILQMTEEAKPARPQLVPEAIPEEKLTRAIKKPGSPMEPAWDEAEVDRILKALDEAEGTPPELRARVTEGGPVKDVEELQQLKRTPPQEQTPSPAPETTAFDNLKVEAERVGLPKDAVDDAVQIYDDLYSHVSDRPASGTDKARIGFAGEEGSPSGEMRSLRNVLDEMKANGYALRYNPDGSGTLVDSTGQELRRFRSLAGQNTTDELTRFVESIPKFERSAVAVAQKSGLAAQAAERDIVEPLAAVAGKRLTRPKGNRPIRPRTDVPFGKSIAVPATGRAKASTEDPLLTWLKKKGGLDLTEAQAEGLGGEAKYLSGKEGRYIGLTKKSGGYGGFDRILRAAKEDGFLPESATINDLIEAFSRDLAAVKAKTPGKRVYSMISRKWDEIAEAEERSYYERAMGGTSEFQDYMAAARYAEERGVLSEIARYMQPIYWFTRNVENKFKLPLHSRMYAPMEEAFLNTQKYYTDLMRPVDKLLKPFSAESRRKIGVFLDNEHRVAPDIMKRQLQMTDEEVAATREMRKYFDEWFELAGIAPEKYRKSYLPMLKQKMERGKIEIEALPDELKESFFADYARHGTLEDTLREWDVGELARRYAWGLSKSRILKPRYNQVSDLLNRTAGDKFIFPESIRDRLGGYMESIMGKPPLFDVQLERSVSRVLGKLSKGKISEKDLQGITQTFLSNAYSGFLGFRPYAIIRNTFQPLLTTYPLLGHHLFRGYRQLFTKEGWDLVKAGKILSEMPLPYGQELENLFVGGAQRLSRKISKAGLYGYRRADDLNRAASYLGGRSKALEAIDKAKHFGDFLERAEVFDDALINRYRPLWERGKFTKLVDDYARDITEVTQYIYRRANSPQYMQNIVGRLAGMFGTWPTWYINYLAREVALVGRGGSKAANYARMKRISRWLGVSAATTTVGAEVFGVDIHDWALFSPLKWSGGPGMALMDDVYDWAFGPEWQSAMAARRIKRSGAAFVVPGALQWQRMTPMLPEEGVGGFIGGKGARLFSDELPASRVLGFKKLEEKPENLRELAGLQFGRAPVLRRLLRQ